MPHSNSIRIPGAFTNTPNTPATLFFDAVSEQPSRRGSDDDMTGPVNPPSSEPKTSLSSSATQDTKTEARNTKTPTNDYDERERDLRARLEAYNNSLVTGNTPLLPYRIISTTQPSSPTFRLPSPLLPLPSPRQPLPRLLPEILPNPVYCVHCDILVSSIQNYADHLYVHSIECPGLLPRLLSFFHVSRQSMEWRARGNAFRAAVMVMDGLHPGELDSGSEDEEDREEISRSWMGLEGER